MAGIVGQPRDLDKSLASHSEYRDLARANHKQQAGSQGKKDGPTKDGASAKGSATDGNGQPLAGQAGQASAGSSPAGFDAAVDAFVKKARAEFTVPERGVSPSKGAYHPAPTNLPVRWLCVGVLIGATVMALAALALRR